MNVKIFFIFIFVFSLLRADVIKPAYLEIIEEKEHAYTILLKIAVDEEKKPSVTLKVMDGCQKKDPSSMRFLKASYLEQYTLVCEESIKGKLIEVEGLENRKSDLLLRLEFLDNSSQSMLLNTLENSYLVEEDASLSQIVQTYTWLGITHILMGFDHLLFVFLLLLLVKSLKRLLWTVSAFTLAHSLTMAGATLGLVQLPQQPVEAIIALSIVFLALELMYEKQGKVGLTSQYPWLVAFIFGLLHGFGFAGVLAEIGLPHEAITLALVFFNIGVELGQLSFIVLIVLIAWLLKRLLTQKTMEGIEVFIIYAIGGLASFWMIERVLVF
ncbi:MAG: membrane protein, putative [uncultured Sulfurovum sp.]|uniref:Membrane protein, putative n=1 Tax=uncultured Sulfurovum sp. TaxID=269237 RepID=A0A6S6SLM8_9BACT|nr:MAG: membrane protein, putative [uncultured Sulfurovum sp.]